MVSFRGQEKLEPHQDWSVFQNFQRASNLRVFFLLVAFQLLDTDNDGYLSYSELFSLFRMVTGPTMTDDHVLGIITSILSRSDLQQPTRLTFVELTQVRHESVF